jgi:hypothetical protein
MSDYIPTREDTAWAEGLTRMLRDGGIWGYPDALLTYRIDHENKELLLYFGDPDHPMHERTRIVFAEIGYTVKVPA